MQNKTVSRKAKLWIGRTDLDGAYRAHLHVIAALTLFILFSAKPISAAPMEVRVAYQPMTSEGLAANCPFESWIVFRDPNPSEPGYALPAGAQPGIAEIAAQLRGGPPYTLHVVVGSSDKLTEKQAEVARKGALVMPFNLDQTRHIFSMTQDGGIQSVVARDRNNRSQIDLIRKHLREETDKFRRGDFSDPEEIHGSDMPGLAELKRGYSKMEIRYEDLPDGARISYSTKDPALIMALHRWFHAQVAEHGKHAM